ncbi:unnamed protein product [Staurois parvus]|uniref:Uncharacterized protein n=1 Tax=Staurois parvus TaxID=386267 RepID=A0ABN9EHN2_9NEOB|nr:unnamed protein product [Staurois parvus]
MGPPGNRESWGPCPCPNSKNAYEKGTRGISWGPLLTPGPRAVPEWLNGQSAPVPDCFREIQRVEAETAVCVEIS